MPNAEKMGLKLAKLWVAKKGDANRLSCYLGIVSLAMKKKDTKQIIQADQLECTKECFHCSSCGENLI